MMVNRRSKEGATAPPPSDLGTDGRCRASRHSGHEQPHTMSELVVRDSVRPGARSQRKTLTKPNIKPNRTYFQLVHHVCKELGRDQDCDGAPGRIVERADGRRPPTRGNMLGCVKPLPRYIVSQHRVGLGLEKPEDSRVSAMATQTSPRVG